MNFDLTLPVVGRSKALDTHVDSQTLLSNELRFPTGFLLGPCPEPARGGTPQCQRAQSTADDQRLSFQGDFSPRFPMTYCETHLMTMRGKDWT
jgi:hypothetical protein